MGIDIPPEYGYVLLAASGTFVVNLWQMMKIGSKRKEWGIEVSLSRISQSLFHSKISLSLIHTNSTLFCTVSSNVV